MMGDLVAQFLALSATERVWLVVGFAAQGLFAARMLVQWLASERARASVVPEAFWYLSFAGGVLLFAYAIYRRDPVFILGQGMPLLIYSRNIWLIWRNKLEGKRGDPFAPD